MRQSCHAKIFLHHTHRACGCASTCNNKGCPLPVLVCFTGYNINDNALLIKGHILTFYLYQLITTEKTSKCYQTHSKQPNIREGRSGSTMACNISMDTGSFLTLGLHSIRLKPSNTDWTNGDPVGDSTLYTRHLMHPCQCMHHLFYC